MAKVLIDPLSKTSLRVEPRFQNVNLATATGFVVQRGDKYFLITNWHVVSGRHAETDACLDKENLAIPDRLAVRFHRRGVLGSWIEVVLPLLDEEGLPLWREHPEGSRVDVVALPLADLDEVDLFALDLALANTDMAATPGMPVCIIGYPFGLVAGESWPIWKTGHTASDPDVDFAPNRPAFLIDATTRAGMSGAPVVLRLSGGFTTSDGRMIMAGGVQTKFMGVYAGRIHDESEIGRVWRPRVIDEVLQGRVATVVSPVTGIGRLDPCLCGSNKRYKNCCGSLVGPAVMPAGSLT